MTVSTSRIIELAQSIVDHTTTIDTALTFRGLPSPTFDPNVNITFPAEVASSRDAVLDATQELHDLLLGPICLVQQKANYNNLASLRAISEYNIATAFPPEETVTYTQLSRYCGLAEKPLRHLLRHAMTMRIFSEPEKGVVAHTAPSRTLRDSNWAAWLQVLVTDAWPASVKLVDALSKWPSSEEPTETGWSLAHNDSKPTYESLSADSALTVRFRASTAAIVPDDPAFDPVHLHRSFDWKGIGSGLVVDVGGLQGAISVSLAREYRDLRFISQDLERAIDSAPVDALPERVKGRVELIIHDFFTPQPVVGAEVYLFRWILHNWSDEYAIKILRALIPALKINARILIQDGCQPSHDIVPHWKEKVIRNTDLLMKTMFNAWERDAEEWQELFAKVDRRLEFIGMHEPKGSALMLIELRWMGDCDAVEA